MTPAETITRSENAKRILDDPLVKEALEAIERDVIEAFIACPVRDTEGMRILHSELRRARKFRDILQGIIEKGRLAADDIRERESFMERVAKKVRF